MAISSVSTPPPSLPAAQSTPSRPADGQFEKAVEGTTEGGGRGGVTGEFQGNDAVFKDAFEDVQKSGGSIGGDDLFE